VIKQRLAVVRKRRKLWESRCRCRCRSGNFQKSFWKQRKHETIGTLRESLTLEVPGGEGNHT
jgi:hypothetical protein